MTTARTAQTAPTPQEIRTGWDRVARGFDELLRRHGVTAGTRFLDVAAGSGALAIPAAPPRRRRRGHRHLTGHDRAARRPRP